MTDITPSPKDEKNPIVEIGPDIILKKTSIGLQNFELKKQEIIGRGGTSLVYTACEKKTTNCQYVVKTIFGNAAYSKRENECLDYLERIKREILISRIMSDLGVGPKVFETAIDKNNKIGYIVMEKFDGTLPDLFFQNDEQEEAIDYAKQIKPLLTKMHKEGIIHGHLRPKNILFQRIKDQDQKEDQEYQDRPSVRLVVSDFGHAFFSNDRRLVQADFDRLFRSQVSNVPRFVKNGNDCTF